MVFKVQTLLFKLLSDILFVQIAIESQMNCILFFLRVGTVAKFICDSSAIQLRFICNSPAICLRGGPPLLTSLKNWGIKWFSVYSVFNKIYDFMQWVKKCMLHIYKAAQNYLYSPINFILFIGSKCLWNNT